MAEMVLGRRRGKDPATKPILAMNKALSKRPKGLKVARNVLLNLAKETDRMRLNDNVKPDAGFGKPKARKRAQKATAHEARHEDPNPMEVVAPAAEAHALLPKGVDDIDRDDCEDPQMASENVNRIYAYMRQLEGDHRVPNGFLAGGRISARMRAVLINWLQEVHLQFKLLQETMYLTVHLVDKYLAIQCHSVSAKNLQLLGVTAMLIACKYEEMLIPEVGDFVYITDDNYDSSEILAMELNVLRVLDFKLGMPLSLNFLRRNSKAGMVEVKQHAFAKYLLELSMIEYSLAAVKPSRMAAAALLLSLKIHSPESPFERLWSRSLCYYSGYGPADLRSVVAKMSALLLGAESSKFKAAFDKYQSPSRFGVSNVPFALHGFLLDVADHPEGH